MNVFVTVKLLHISPYIVLNIHESRRLQLTDTAESLWHSVRDNGHAFDKLHFIVATRSDAIISRNKDLLVKYALFDFLISIIRDL